MKHFTVCDFSGTRNPGGGGGGGNGMLDMSELVEVTFLRRSASASRLLPPAPARGAPALASSVVAETASTPVAQFVFFGPSVSTSKYVTQIQNLLFQRSINLESKF